MSFIKNYLFFISFLLFFLNSQGQNSTIFPGGVNGAESWYIANEQDLNIGTFQNFSQRNIQFTPYGVYDQKLLNFNPTLALKESEFYLKYTAELESNSNRNLLIAVVPGNLSNSYPLFGTSFNDHVPISYLDSLSRNTFVIETQQGYASSMNATFTEHQNAHVYNYRWSNYTMDKKFKSYGLEGESNIFIGRDMQSP
ncbi:hypothetical protein, partial [uncultured Planktosalinus sp.]|uniref:hypothetical protein n=1 Tax=uncultured Planktosalinus sp. TaxID=1810935 RepID=UPI0030DBE949